MKILNKVSMVEDNLQAPTMKMGSAQYLLNARVFGIR